MTATWVCPHASTTAQMPRFRWSMTATWRLLFMISPINNRPNALIPLVNDRRLARIPMIIETPKEDDLEEDRKNLKVLRSLVKKVPTRRRR